MRRDLRAKRQRLTAALERLDAAERRTLADLATAGYSFTTIESARRHQAQLKAIDRFDTDQDADALAAAFDTTNTARRTA